MKHLRNLALTALAVNWSTQANAARYAWCQVDSGNTRYLTGIIEIDAESANALESDPWSEAFETHVRSISGRAGHADCWSKSTFYDAKKFIRESMYGSDIDWRQTEWFGGRPAATEGKPQADRSSGVHILIEDASPTQASPAELAEIRLQAEREDAARRAKAAAEHARTDVELQAKIKKFFEDAKKRGNAQ